MPCCFLAEKAILKYCNWIINIDTPSFIIDKILYDLFSKYKNDQKVIEALNKYKDISITILQFAMCEYNIYYKYNQFIISLCSLVISVNLEIDVNEEIKKCINNINLQQELKKILGNIVNNIDFVKNLIDSCKSLILKKLEKEEDINDDEKDNQKQEKEKEDNYNINYQLEITRSDSILSFSEAINNYNFEKDLEDISYNNNIINNQLIEFGEYSPIINEEIISLFKEEKEDDENNDYLSNYSNIENNNNKKSKESILFLKHKRNINISSS